MNHRTTALAYAPDERSRTNKYAVHEILNAQPDRVALVNSKHWSTDEARALVQARNRRVNSNSTDNSSIRINRPDLLAGIRSCIYWLRNVSSEVIYVGKAVDAYNRINGHRKQDRWWDEVTQIETRPVPRRDLAREERAEIHRLHPRYNYVCVACDDTA